MAGKYLPRSVVPTANSYRRMVHESGDHRLEPPDSSWRLKENCFVALGIKNSVAKNSPRPPYRLRRNWELESMVPNFVCCPAVASGSGHCPAALSSSPEGGQSDMLSLYTIFARLARSPGRRPCPTVARGGKRCGEPRCSTTHEESGRSDLWRPNSCGPPRQQLAVGPADREVLWGAALFYNPRRILRL